MKQQQIKKNLTAIHGFLVLCGALIFSAGKVAALPVSTGANPYRAHMIPEKGNVAIFGYDPVAYFIEGRAVKGKDEFEQEFENVRWRFSSADNRDAFIGNPEDYVPQYGGFCTVCIVEDEGLFDANPRFWTIVKGKLYLNNDSRSREKFRRNTSLYIQWANEAWAKLAPPAEPGEDIKEGSRESSYKVGLFPTIVNKTSMGISDDAKDEIRKSVNAYIDGTESLQLAYDYELVQLSQRALSEEDVWSDSVVSPQPVLDFVVKRAAELGVHGVVMASVWLGTTYEPATQARLHLYAIDATEGRVFKESGFVFEAEILLKKAFSKFRPSDAGSSAKRKSSESGYKIGVFPFFLINRGRTWAEDTELAVKDKIKSYLDANESFQIAYDYDAVPSGGQVVSTEQIWPGGFGSQQPVLESVMKFAEQIGVQGVVTAWIRVARQDEGVSGGQVDVYVIDSVQKSIHKESGVVGNIDDIVEKAFSNFRPADVKSSAFETFVAQNVDLNAH